MPSAEMPALAPLAGPGWWAANRVRWHAMTGVLRYIGTLAVEDVRHAYATFRALAAITDTRWWLDRRKLTPAQLLTIRIPPNSLGPELHPSGPPLHPRPEQLK